MKVNADDFYSSVIRIYKTYSDEVHEEINKSVENVAKESRNELKVAGSFKNKSGKYRKGWTISFEKKRHGVEAIVHNKVYQLTHLLENGHALVRGGRQIGQVRAFPHIEQVNEEAQRKLQEEIERIVGE